jgi:bifunctional UDP-N-acetylglucosamine pyrophosphorylase/glucosamine-1-phosphate N-acetyltransferase
MSSELLALILAAGKGTRFKSEKIKVLYPLMGKLMLHHVLSTITGLKPGRIYVIVGYQKDKVIEASAGMDVEFVTQTKQLGTGHAVRSAKSFLEKNQEKHVLVMNGDLPLIRQETLKSMWRHHKKEQNSLTLLTAEMDNPYGFGRIIRSGKDEFRIVEEKDASASQKRIQEINAGVYIFAIGHLLKALPKISNINQKKEYYLTDIVEILMDEGKKVGAFKTSNQDEIVGINDRIELARAIEILRLRKIKNLAMNGVTINDPASTWIDLDAEIGMDTTIYPAVIVEGDSKIGKNCILYPFTHIVDSKIANGVRVLSSTMIENSTIEDDVQVGPFTHLRPKTILKKGARVGNFVEMKKTRFGEGSKAGHLSYIGDAEVGKKVNVGAGTITCNYDGMNKLKTVIEDGAFIGSGAQLVAPLKIGKGAYIGAGSTITKDVSPDALGITRGKQMEKAGWARRKRKK